MESKKMNIVYKKVKDLIPYENNPRNNDEAVDYVAKSIEEFGFKVPCVVSGDGVLITGHTRLKACKKLGIDEVPCIVADDLTEDQIKAFRIADNKVSEYSTWDNTKLAEELSDIMMDMTQFGDDLFKDDDIICEAFDKPDVKAMLTEQLLCYYPEKTLICGSGMAGYGSSNTIKTRKINDHFYICGDGVSGAMPGRGLMAPRVTICAAHEANMVLRCVLGLDADEI